MAPEYRYVWLHLGGKLQHYVPPVPARGAEPTSLRLPAWLLGAPWQWRLGTLDRDALHGSAQAQACRPGHLEAAQRLAGAVLGMLDRHPLARRVMHDAPMYLLLVCCMALHHRREEGDPAGGITLKSLRGLFDPQRLPQAFAGDSHLRDMLSWARVCGLLQAVETGIGATDRRVRRYEPAAALEQLFSGWMVAFLRATDPPFCWPWGGALPTREDVYEVLAYRIEALVHDRFVLTERYPLVQQMMLRRHGYHVFLALIEGMHVQGDGSALAQLSISGLSQRFEVARGTIRKTLELVAQSGMLQLRMSGSSFELSRAFVDYALSWMALEMTYMHGLCVASQLRPQREQGRTGPSQARSA